MLALIATSLLCWQDPEPKQDPKPAPKPVVEAPAPAPAEVWDDRTARDKVKEFDKLMKGSPSMGERQRALELLGQGSNAQLLKPLARVVETDKSVVIRKHAAALLAVQPADKANQAIQKLLRNAKATSNPAVHAELIRGLARCGYESKHWDDLDLADMFASDYDTERVPVHEAILDLVTQHKEKRALKLLLKNLDEPSPESVDDASNPPAEYWKARWHSWAAWRGKVKDALFAITGQRFSTAAEAKSWLEKNPVR